MTNLRLTLEYDGTAFKGWARQPGERTVEGVVREALTTVLPEWDQLSVAGRTDTGVHATGQVVSLACSGGPPLERLPEAVNAVLPVDVAVVGADLVADDFNARFSARARSYRYVVYTRAQRSPHTARRTMWWPRPLDDEALDRAAAALIGEHDFRAFTPTETQHTVFRRNVTAAAWERRGDELHFTITADAFLRHMVRTLVGSMLEGCNLEPLLVGRPRSEAGMTAPPQGLTLEHVRYDA